MEYFSLHPFTRSLDPGPAVRPVSDKSPQQQRVEWDAFKDRVRAVRPDLVHNRTR